MMRKLKIVVYTCLLSVGITFWNCSTGDSIFIPAIDAATWENQADPTNQFFFFNVTPSVNTSAFDGNDNGSWGTHSFSGSFTNHNIQFTYDNNSDNKSGRTYSGTIDNDSKVIVLSGQGLPNLRLEKQ